MYGFAGMSKNLMLDKGITKLVILYTNDQHSRIDPFPANDPKNPDQGGFARRASVIKKIRATEPNVLLLDAGDIFQGTPYFNLYQGEVEYKLMSEMGYDCTTLGNHDFDLGMENVVKQMPHAKFDFVCANYIFKNTPLENKIKPYKIYNRGGLRIGVFGLGIELAGLVSKKLYGDTQYFNPVMVANDIAKTLKKEEKCDYVICLSHLGYKYEDKKVSDMTLSEETKDIDIIIGAHTHTFLEKPVLKANAEKKEVHVTQVGWAGIWLGRIDVAFSHNNKKNSTETAYYKILKSQA
ncbi:MAG: metallophosphatase [Bacteroidia bacterium]|nr:metallophosphatase [Bacteroidia bacterium]